jgi:hypothetical protein
MFIDEGCAKVLFLNYNKDISEWRLEGVKNFDTQVRGMLEKCKLMNVAIFSNI